MNSPESMHLVGALVMTMAISILFSLRSRKSLASAFAWGFVITFSIGLLKECFDIAVNPWNMEFGLLIWDTIGDIFRNAVGCVCGVIIMVVFCVFYK
jgi:glycopeptide antibiotics resistance protein